MPNSPPRVGEIISLTYTDNTTFDGSVEIIRKELPCSRFLARGSDGRYFTLFTNERSGHWWYVNDSETDRMNGEAR